MEKNSNPKRLHRNKRTVYSIAIFLTLGISLMFSGCSNSNSSSQSIKNLQSLSGKTVIQGVTATDLEVNGIDAPVKMTFSNDGVKIKSNNEGANDERRAGKTYYYLPVTKDQLIKQLPQDEKLNNFQFNGGSSQVPKHVQKIINYVKKSNNKDYVILSPKKYKSLEEFQKQADPNNINVGNGYEIWEVKKTENSVSLINLEEVSTKTEYRPMKIKI